MRARILSALTKYGPGVLGPILIAVGIGFIYLPAAFIAAGVALLVADLVLDT